MFKKSGNDTLVDQGKSLASDISDAIAPHVERAREEVGPRLAEAKDAIAPKLVEARDQAVPLVESARDKIVNEVVPAVKVALADAAEQAAPVVEEAKKRGSTAVDALKGEDLQPKKKGRKRKFFLFAAVAGAGAYVFSKVRGKDESANWQSSYTPSPSPAAPPAPASPAAPMGGSHAADSPATGDSAGASPGESISDAAEEPHPVTTPDAPAEEVEVTDEADATATGAAKKAAKKKA